MVYFFGMSTSTKASELRLELWHFSCTRLELSTFPRKSELQHRWTSVLGNSWKYPGTISPLWSLNIRDCRQDWPGKVASKAAKASMVSSPRMFLRDRTNMDQQSNVLFHWSPRYGIWWDLGNDAVSFIFWTFQVDQQHVFRDDYCTVS